MKEEDKGKTLLNLDAISHYYSAWIRSSPYDVGKATRNALEIFKREEPSYLKARNASLKNNQDS
jgi:hypothetical protein